VEVCWPAHLAPEGDSSIDPVHGQRQYRPPSGELLFDSQNTSATLYALYAQLTFRRPTFRPLAGLNCECGVSSRRVSIRTWITLPPGGAEFLRSRPSIRPRKKGGLLGANGLRQCFCKKLVRSPRVAAIVSRRIEGRSCLSTVPAGQVSRPNPLGHGASKAALLTRAALRLVCYRGTS
jgi:hypothetical protein